MYRAKDFIQVGDTLLFAVVADGLEADKVLCFLRYARWQGGWRKLDTAAANAVLAESAPQYLHYSIALDAALHAVPVSDISHHHKPQLKLAALMGAMPADAVQTDLQALGGLLQSRGLPLEHFGVTGSLLVDMQRRDSDIDLVCYDRNSFHQARHLVQSLIGEGHCHALSDSDWLEAYQRRACDFPLDEYVWHELRKYNKALINQRKFDLSLISMGTERTESRVQKLGPVRLETNVTDDTRSFDYPATLGIDHPQADSVLIFTATYCGQARRGERIMVSGNLEKDIDGRQRVVIGSSREAYGEYVKVLH